MPVGSRFAPIFRFRAFPIFLWPAIRRTALDGTGKALPGVAPVAKQQGQYIARLLIERAQGRNLPAFRYSDLGMMATIGRKRAVVQAGSLRFTGFLAWLVWCVAHIYFPDRL